ncbi:transposase [Cytobacillus firmus]|uniref:transposase n=1 Tax=Cytobacillus firmus TaxID=1399 RepID=UPI0018CE0258|nr:transposase [Cytobacillus firmus]
MKEVSTQKKYQVIKEMSQGDYSIVLLCKIAEVSKSGYYKWLKRQESPTEKQLEDEEIKEKIMECHEKLKGIYGYRRVQIWLVKTTKHI